jgi:ribosomal protein S18 acetylase RimI-like enzyme
MLSHRVATLADVPSIVALVESAYRGDASRAGWTTEADLLHGQRTDAAMVEDIIRDPHQVLLLFFEAGLVGCLDAARHPGFAYFGMISVNPQIQGSGIGRQMLTAAEVYVTHNWQSPVARMTVMQQRTELIAWYQRRGYALTGETSPFPYGDPRFGLPQRDDLSMLVLAKVLAGGIIDAA